MCALPSGEGRSGIHTIQSLDKVRGCRLDWTGVKLVLPPEYIAANVVDVMVEGDGSDLRSFISDRWNMVDAWLQLSPEEQ